MADPIEIIVQQTTGTVGRDTQTPVYHTSISVPLEKHNNLGLRQATESEVRRIAREQGDQTSDYSSLLHPTYQMQMHCIATSSKDLTEEMAGAVCDGFGLEYKFVE